jgi:hypothetical protein
MATQQAFCHLCGQPISGQGRLYRHPDWPAGRVLRVCENCERSQPRCRVCGLPYQGGEAAVDQAGAGLCETCRQKQAAPAAAIKPAAAGKPPAPGPACRACGRPVSGRYYEFEGFGPYCEACLRQRPPCSLCGAPLTDERWQLSDGRITCAHCHVTAVYNAAEAAQLFEMMKTVIETELGLRLNVPTGLALVDINQLAEVIRHQNRRGAGQPAPQAAIPEGSAPQPVAAATQSPLNAEHTLGLYARDGIRRGIYIQSGLPCPVFLQVAAHEYAHAWEGENCPLLRDPLMQEGLAEWVAYRVLGHYHGSCGLAPEAPEAETHARQQMLKREDVYGQGLRWALDVENRQGGAALLELCRRAV